MTTEKKKERDGEQVCLLITVVFAGLFLGAGWKWMDKNIPDSFVGNASYALLPLAAMQSALGLVRLVQDQVKRKKS